MIWISLAAVVVLLMFSAFFSGSETALTSLSRARMHHLAADGDARARLVDILLKGRERLLGTILVGNNLVNILASVLATGVFLELVGQAGLIYATLIMTLLVVVFAEILPKTWAIRNAERLALMVAPPLRFFVWAMTPVTKTLQVVVYGCMVLLRIDPGRGGELLSAYEELRGAIDLHHREGKVVKAERDMLGGILNLREITVSEVMVHRKNMFMVDAAHSSRKIFDQIVTSPHTRVPVWRGDAENVIGILHVRDILKAIAQRRGDIDSVDITSLIRKPWFVPETTDLDQQLRAFLQSKNHFACVVDEYGALMGIITLEDILEEIVGDIADEHDLSPKGIRATADGSVIVDGGVAIRDLNRAQDWNLPGEEANTVAGLVIHEAHMIPEAGRAFNFHGFRFEILERRRNQLISIRLTPPKTPPPKTGQ
ncbi:MAG: HlyC/CorC family transporter [Hyphomicrobiales bacterium]|nr:HlyC/CorC family transporter [Hyphomicrobiales bacterium]MCY4049680.1 HlyC/CorC family transporter [Hyphomicrobiales bacterium]MCY4052978.1 HlyC/CorC family transporter [Hyphomicrobiales bacterium]